jgi:hypothetical protein
LTDEKNIISSSAREYVIGLYAYIESKGNQDPVYAYLNKKDSKLLNDEILSLGVYIAHNEELFSIVKSNATK